MRPAVRTAHPRKSKSLKRLRAPPTAKRRAFASGPFDPGLVQVTLSYVENYKPRDSTGSRPSGLPTQPTSRWPSSNWSAARPTGIGSEPLYVRGPLHARSHERGEILPFRRSSGQTARRRAVGKSSSRAPGDSGRRCVTSRFGCGSTSSHASELHPVSREFSTALGLPRRARMTGMTPGRVEFGGGQSRRCRLYFRSRRCSGKCGRAAREIARVPRHRFQPVRP